MKSSVSGTASDRHQRSRIRSRQSLSNKQFDKEHFNNLIQRRDFLTQQRDYIRSNSWTTTTSRRQISNHAAGAGQHADASRVLNFDSHTYSPPVNSLGFGTARGQGPQATLAEVENHQKRNYFQNGETTSKSQSLTMQSQSQQIHNQRSTLLQSQSSLKYLNSNGAYAQHVGKANMHRDRFQSSTQKQSSSLSSMTTNSNARTALVELGSKYKAASPNCITEININGTDANRPQENQHSYSVASIPADVTTIPMNCSFDLVTAAESEDEGNGYGHDFEGFKDDVSTAMLTSTASLEHTHNDLSSMLNSGTSLNGTTNIHNELNQNSDQTDMDELLGDSDTSQCNDNDDNVDYLLQLSTLIGRGMPKSPSSSSSPPSSNVQNIDETASVESFHSSQDIGICVELTAYDHDDTSVLSALSFDCAQSTMYTRAVTCVTSLGKKEKGQGSALFRWCGLLWLVSMVLVYERSMNNEIYFISQRRRILEDAFREKMSLLNKAVDGNLGNWREISYSFASQAVLNISTQWGSARDLLDSYALKDMNLFDASLRIPQDWSSLLRNSSPKPIVENTNPVGMATEERTDSTGKVEEREESDADLIAGVDRLPKQDQTLALHSQFNQDMMLCSGTAVADEIDSAQTLALHSQFYQDMTPCLSAAVDNEFHNEQRTLALHSQFYQDMTPCLSAAIADDSMTCVISILFYEQMMGYKEEEDDDHDFGGVRVRDLSLSEVSEEPVTPLDNKGYTDFLVFSFYHDMTMNIEEWDQYDLNHRPFWSKRPTNIPFLSAKRDIEPTKLGMEIVDVNFNKSTERSECLLSDVGLNPYIEDASSFPSQHLVAVEKNERSKNMAIEYFNEQKDVDEEIPILDGLLDFFRVVGKSWRQRRKDKKQAKQEEKRRKQNERSLRFPK